jgi:hypothetical protein
MGNNCMKAARWTWASARSIGTSHLQAGKGCDDFGACLEVMTDKMEPVLIAVASDGAGSATHSATGAWITSRVFIDCAARFIKCGGQINDLSLDVAKEWLDSIRDRIIVAAKKCGATPRDFAATLVGSIVGSERTVFIHIGDGGSVFEDPVAGDWTVGTWPEHGEYASTTYFVTDDPEPHCQFLSVAQPIRQLALFSDGIERLVLDFSSRRAFSPFFERMFDSLKCSAIGRNRVISRDLRRFLDGPSVCERTDDDKTLILAKRIGS